MSFPINTQIPLGSHDPADDVPEIRDNFVNIDGFLKVDHVAPGNIQNGYHEQVTFNKNNAQGAVTNPLSILYTSPGTASSFVQLVFKNQNAILPISTIRAWAHVIVGAPPTFVQNINVSTVTRNGDGDYSIVLTTNAVSSNDFAVLVSSTAVQGNTTSSTTYSITGSGTFDLKFRVPSSGALKDPVSFSFQVMQI